MIPDETRNAHRAELDRQIPFVYDDLIRIAQRQLNRELGPRSVQAATLVHEAYLKLAGSPPSSVDRDHLLAIAARAMRQVLVERARSRAASKREGELVRTTLTDASGEVSLDDTSLLALNDAIERLEPRQRQVVECRFFGGLNEEETAAALGVTSRTVRRDWIKARAWLGRWLHDGEPS
jgi:RNA polymerase sigma factor (TIGR02999 family)